MKVLTKLQESLWKLSYINEAPRVFIKQNINFSLSFFLNLLLKFIGTFCFFFLVFQNYIQLKTQISKANVKLRMAEAAHKKIILRAEPSGTI